MTLQANNLAAEKAQRDAVDKAKADKAKLADDRHKANSETLANLQKLLVSRHVALANTTAR